MTNLARSARDVLVSLLSWVGLLVGVLSAISAINHVLDIGLEGFFADCVTFYRQLMSPLYDLLRRITLPFRISDLALDIAALYFVLFTMAFRTSIIPLSDKEYLGDERMGDAEYWTVHAGEMVEPFEDNMIYASQNEDGTYTKRMYRLKPSWVTIAKSFALALSLWPVVTLAPARNLHLSKYVFRSDGEDLGELIKFDRGMVSKKYLRLTRMRLLLAFQIALVPVAVVLFYVLAKFNPLSS